MKTNTVEIVWHKKEAVHAVDILPFRVDGVPGWKIASGGVDTMVRTWQMVTKENGEHEVTHKGTLARHEKGIGAVRFSPQVRNGKTVLATASDDSYVMVWLLDPDRAAPPVFGQDNDEDQGTECWTTECTLRGHIEDVVDLSWSADGVRLASCGIDNTVIVWDVWGKLKLAQIQNHTHYVQGVGLDPFGKIVATLSADRSLRLFVEKDKKVKKDKFICKANIAKVQPPGYIRPVRLWWDDTLAGFVRRLSWSPDGLFLACPSGELNPPPTSKNEDDKMEISDEDSNDDRQQKKECVVVFTRGNFRDPTFMMVTPDATMVTRWCPTLFKLRPSSSNVTTLNYKMVLAAISETSVILFDTQLMRPIARVSDIHYANMTDLAWTPDGRVLLVSSRDGYVTRIEFDEGELGEIYERTIDDVRTSVLELMCTSLESDEEEIIEGNALSPAVQKMNITSTKSPTTTSPTTYTTKKRQSITTTTQGNNKPPEKKTKKKVALTTISSTLQ